MGDFATADTCVECHPDHVSQWRTSRHAWAMDDPVFRALLDVRDADMGEGARDFCTECHSVIGTRAGVARSEPDDLDPVVREGVSCATCHSAIEVTRPHDAGLVLDPSMPLGGPFDDPIATDAHQSEGRALFESSALCGSCHDVTELSGLVLESPYAEWEASPAAEAGLTCQGCHMPARSGTAAPGGPIRTLHDHYFTGVDLPLSDAARAVVDVELARARAANLIVSSGQMEVVADAPARGEPIRVDISLINQISGHSLPTGSTFSRQVWVELIATDADGAVLYASGDLDANGDLRDRWSVFDPHGDGDLIALHSRLLGPGAVPTPFTHVAESLISVALAPEERREYRRGVPTAIDTPGPITIRARWLFRAYPPWLFRVLDLDELIPRIETYELSRAELVVP